MPITYSDHEKKMKSPAVCELLPLRDLPAGDDVMVHTNGAFVAGYELRGVLAYFATDEDRNQTKTMLEAMFRAVPDVSMRIQFRYEISERLGGLLDSYVAQQRNAQLEVVALDGHRLRMWQQKESEGFFFENRLHVYFVWDPRVHAKLYHSAQQRRKAGGFTLSQTKAIRKNRKEHEAQLAELESILRGIEGSMESADLEPRRLSTQDLFDELSNSQHPVRRNTRPYVPGEERIAYRSAREQVVHASILHESETYLNIDGYLYSVISLKDLPDATFPGMLQSFSALGFPLVVSGQVVIPDQVKVLKSYKKRLQKMTAAQKDANGNFKSNPEAEVAQAQLIQVQRDIISSSLKTAKLSLCVVVRTSRPAVTFADLEQAERDLANRTQEVLNAFTHMNGAKAVMETIAKRRIFIGTLPGMAEPDKRDQDMLTSNVADLVPVEMPWTGTRRSPLILFETPFRQLIPFSMFDPDLSDANGLLMAKSGGGKTLAAQQMLLMAARANPLISILERGDSYQPLVELMGGEMIEMSLDSDQTINPWDLPKGESKPSNDQISFLKNLTRHMLGENTPPNLDIDLLDSVLIEAIASTYKRCSAKTSNPIPLFGDLAAELAHWQDRDRNQTINAMAQLASTKLRAWVEDGPYARLFDRQTTVQLNNPWLYFNVEKLKDDPRLERAMSLLIAHTATYRASGFTGQPSIVLLDECWALLESPILASVVVQLFRTARKRNASVWGISQTPEDFVGTPDRPNEYGAGIVKNATTKIIGKQPGDMTALRDHLHLNETALNQIKTFAHPKKGYSAEFLIAVGEKAESTHAIRVVPSPVDYWITTTYARERHYRRWWLHQHRQLSKLEAYEQLAARYPRGLAMLPPLPVELSGEMQEVTSR
ncbi:Type IV secretory pathway, VirB4 component [Granulicella rosea]|uniref:Type IV secretory pathway, VirB4 component n=1 Tax=Granulicella rosea TaxID=474952 RepID=A0A239E6M5_9BACT|nr:VirB4 family type IV secretion system protein [Granulicella rosea]SNS40365.1 Type IV secretory pathway, VirB4 component [Granulicella rosea]